MRTARETVSDSTVERILARLKPHLVRVLAESKVSPEDAEDLLQETLVALLFKFESVHNPEAWVLATLRNRCEYHRLRKERLEKEAVGLLPDEFALMPPQEDADLRRDFLRVFARLPHRQRQVVQLRYWGCRNDEVAERLGLEPERARQLTNVTLASLTRELHEAGLSF